MDQRIFDCATLEPGDRIELRGSLHPSLTDVVGVVVAVHPSQVVLMFPSSEGWGDTGTVYLLGAFIEINDQPAAEKAFAPVFVAMGLRAGLTLLTFTYGQGAQTHEFSSVIVTRKGQALHTTHAKEFTTPQSKQANP